MPISRLDGLENNNDGIFIIATTNHPGKIEDTFLRSGRIDRHVQVDLPDWELRLALGLKYLKHIPGLVVNHNAYNIASIAEHTEGWTGADFKRLGSELEMEQLKQNKPLSVEQVTLVYSQVKNERKGNFKTFEAEYKQYREALNET